MHVCVFEWESVCMCVYVLMGECVHVSVCEWESV